MITSVRMVESVRALRHHLSLIDLALIKLVSMILMLSLGCRLLLVKMSTPSAFNSQAFFASDAIRVIFVLVAALHDHRVIVLPLFVGACWLVHLHFMVHLEAFLARFRQNLTSFVTALMLTLVKLIASVLIERRVNILSRAHSDLLFMLC